MATVRPASTPAEAGPQCHDPGGVVTASANFAATTRMGIAEMRLVAGSQLLAPFSREDLRQICNQQDLLKRQSQAAIDVWSAQLGGRTPRLLHAPQNSASYTLNQILRPVDDVAAKAGLFEL